ncbi:helix-turn-helix domain-containing protein [Streptomyces rugosispiralis]|uniref:Helix-turn-helix domain-containing protein n=1 Tax=Streptomyces rugosispiralis TaxID=2967341 RepID=A0ABT1V203_9ACTN|nr:helix-turn-helix transcriptional regulator [Streptomyces rugosispiralis]MCQ8191038.1 helix-turn-helix domain-containing protein [Streptomyces rugosispiralis]
MAARQRELTPDRSARHLFGAELRGHRERAGMSLARLAEVVPSSRSHLARIEVAEYMIPPELPAHLDAAFGTDGLFGKLYALARREVHPDKYRRRMELETRARAIACYAGQLVPGLLQTEDYARALFRVSNPKATVNEIEEKVAARMGRQALLRATPSPHLSVILDEASLRRPVGGAGVMRAQLARLMGLVDTPDSVIQVLPYEHGEHPLMGGTLDLLRLDDGTEVAYEESIDTGQLLEDTETVMARIQAYDLLRAYALSPTQTAAFIRSVMEELTP